MIFSNIPRIEVDGFGFLHSPHNEIVRRYTIVNRRNATVKLISFGAGIQSISVPNKNDDINDVLLGFDSLSGYLKSRYIGRIVGRVSPSFSVKLKSYDDDKNTEGQNNYDIVNWDSYVMGDQVVMTHLDHGNKMGYPGDVLTQVKYTWTDENRLHIDINATTTRSTPINISNHCLFNLAGHAMGAKELKNHFISINADKMLTQNMEEKTHTGLIKKVHKTVYDFRRPIRLNAKTFFKAPGGGYDQYLCINSPSDSWCYRYHARILHLLNGRFLEVYSNHPTLQLYTGNDMPDPTKIHPPDLDIVTRKKIGKIQPEHRIVGKEGMLYKRFAGIATIPQGYPRELDCGCFPSNILHPGKVYVHKISYDFGVVA